MTTGAESISSVPRQMVLLVTDIVDSVPMKRRLGDESFLRLLTRHNDCFRDTLATDANGGQIIKNTGDGFLSRFDTPADAVRFALAFQAALHREPWPGEPVRVRIAIHSGMAMEMTDSPGLADVSGLTVDLAARLNKLALPGQVLLTQQCFNDARQYVREHPSRGEAGPTPTLHWLAHGPYIFKGAEDEAIEVFEVGASGFAPLKPPPDSEGARRSVPAGDEEMYGWRPAKGLEIPRHEGWALQQRLGAGGYGEVWLARHRQMREQRVFKFCFDADRLRSFKRELTLFRLLREALGDRRDIARLYNVSLDRPPFYLESEYSPLGDLHQWSDAQGGIAAVPLETRLQLLAGVAEAVSAAHSIGVLHKDLKPSNVLIELNEDGSPRPKITDFGIGVLADHHRLADHNITVAGFTVTQITENSSGRTGSPMYMPPETLGRIASPDNAARPMPFTAQGDVYALGIMLYQMVIGDLDRPLAQGWERDLDSAIDDPIRKEILRADIARMVDGNPAHRLQSASEVAERIRDLDERTREAIAERDARLKRERKDAYRRRSNAVGIVTIIVASVMALYSERNASDRAEALEQERSLRKQAEEARQLADQREQETERIAAFQAEMLSDIDIAQMGSRMRRGLFDAHLAGFQSPDADPAAVKAARSELDTALAGVNFTDLALAALDESIFDRALKAIDEKFADQPLIQARLLNTIAESMLALGLLDRATEPQQRALKIRRELLGDTDIATLKSMNDMGLLLQEQGHLDEAEPYIRQALDGRRRVLGDDHPDTLVSINNMGYLLGARGDFTGAEPYYRESLERARRTLGNDQPQLANSISNMGYLRQMQGKPDEAEALYREALEIRRRVLGDAHPDTLLSLNNMAGLFLSQGKLDAAEPLWREALAGYRKTYGDDHPDTLTLMNNMAGLCEAQGKVDEAETLLREALAGRRRVLGNDHPATISCISNLGGMLRELGRLDEAATLGAEAVSRAKASLPPGHWVTGVFLSHYGRTLIMMTRFAEAETALLESYSIVQAALGDTHERTLASVHLLTKLYEDWNAAEPDHGYDAKAAEWRDKLPAPEPTREPQP